MHTIDTMEKLIRMQMRVDDVKATNFSHTNPNITFKLEHDPERGYAKAIRVPQKTKVKKKSVN